MDTQIVQTKMGPGTVAMTRDDGFTKVELEWQLANGQKAFLYVKGSELYSDGKKRASTELSDTIPKATFGQYFSVLWPAVLCVFVDFLGLAIAIPILPYFILELSWDLGVKCPTCPSSDASIKCGEIAGCGTAIDVGALGGCFSIGQLIGNIVMGRVSDRVGRKPVIMLSLLMSAVGYFLCGISQTLGEIYVYRILSGLAGGTMPVAISMILDVVQDPAERGKFFGLAGASIGMAFTVGPGVGVAVAYVAGKRAGFFAPTVIAGIVLITAFFKVTETHPSAGILGKRPKYLDEKFGKATKDISPTGNKTKIPRTIFYMFVSFFFGSMAFGTFNSMCALVFLSILNWGTTEIGIILVSYGVINIILSANAQKILDKMRFGKTRGQGFIHTLYLSGFLLAVYLAVFSYVENGVAQIALMVLLLPAAQSAKNPAYNSIVGMLAPVEHRGKANGIVSGAMSVGMGLAPFIAGPVFRSGFMQQTYTYGTFSHFTFFLGAIFAATEVCIILMFVLPAVMKKEAEMAAKENAKKGKKKVKRDSLVIAKERKARKKGAPKESAPEGMKVEIIVD